jgi:hypothetical protein
MWIVLSMILALVAGQYSAERDGVRVRAEIQGNHYVWTVENLSSDPISRFAIDAYHTFGFQVPDGWAFAGGLPTWKFEAWAPKRSAAIKRGGVGRFAVQINNRGAGLGIGACRVSLADESSMIFPAMWRPVPESSRSVFLIPIALSLLAGLHAIVARRRDTSRSNAA